MDFTQPIAGVPPLIWLLFVLIFGPPAILSKAAAEKFGAFGALARWSRNRRLRNLENDRDQLVARFGIEDVAYAALERRMTRLAEQMDAQDRSHRIEMDALKTNFEGQIADLRKDNNQWEDYGDWVGLWASDQVAIIRNNGLEPTPPPFMSFSEFKRWKDASPDT